MAVITLTGPTCAGKSTLEALLKNTGAFCNAVSHTTRAPRAGEADGKAYHFVTREAFMAIADAGDFIELVTFSGNLYGMSRQAIRHALDQAPHVVIVVDPHGCEQILEHCGAENIPVAAVWIDTHPVEQASRWLNRMRDDLPASGDKRLTHQVFTRYAERLGIMLTDEQGWREQTGNRNRTGPDYSLKLHAIDEHKTHQALQQIKMLALATDLGFSVKRVRTVVV